MRISKKDIVKAASLLPALVLLKLGIRFGYGKQLSGVFLKRVGTPEVAVSSI